MADEETTTQPAPTVWAVKLDGKTTRIEDLPLTLIDRVARDNAVSWPDVVLSPCANLSVAMGLIDAVAKHLGTTAPTDLTVKTLLPFFELVPDDVPKSERTPEEDESPFGSNGPETSTT